MGYNIPDVAGVPPIAFNPGIALPTLLTSDNLTGYFAGQFGPQWGVFSNGSSIIAAESVLGVDYKQEWSICNFPVEQGGFESFNKVQLPYQPRVRFAAGENIALRTALLASIAAIAGDLNLYDVVTPDVTYTNVNIEHYDYSRVYDRGNSLLVVDVWLKEIRPAGVSGGTNFQNTANPSSASPINGGTVQSQSPTSSEAAAVAGGLEPM